MVTTQTQSCPASRQRCRKQSTDHSRAGVKPFVNWLGTAIVVIAIVAPARSVYPQALEPRSYVNTPVGINFLLAGYGYTQGNVAFEASSPIEDAKVHVSSGVLAYARSLDVWGLSGKFAVLLPVAKVSGSAKVAGDEREPSRVQAQARAVPKVRNGLGVGIDYS